LDARGPRFDDRDSILARGILVIVGAEDAISNINRRFNVPLYLFSQLLVDLAAPSPVDMLEVAPDPRIS